MASIGLLMIALVPALIRHLDRMASEQESAALKSFADALQQSILRNRSIPGDTDWATNIATELGVELANVTTTARKQPRFFLVDPALQIGTNAAGQAKYTQTSAGSSNRPLSPRVMLVSSIGRALPTSIVSGVASSINFNAIWDWNDRSGALPNTSFGWAGWPNAQDLKVQRVNFSPLFVHLLLNTNASSSKPFYSVDQTNTLSSATNLDGYLIQNSVLFLYDGRANNDSRRILNRDTSFVYDQDVWRESIGGRSGGGSAVAGLDLGSIVDQYLGAPENTNAFNYTPRTGTNQQWFVVSNMMAYLDAYNDWANSNFQDSSKKSKAVSVQDNLVTAVQNQYQDGGQGKNYSPRPYSDGLCP